MPKKKEGYEDALSSIFDFIFANNKSKKGKGFVYKPSGASGTDQMTRALAELASKPGVYLSDAMIKSINETFFDQKLVELYLDKGDDQKYKGYDPKSSRYRVRVSDLGKALSDPRKYVDAIEKKLKEERKWTRLTGAAALLDGAIATGIGLKNGMSIAEASAFGRAARMDYDIQMDEFQKKFASENAAIEAAFESAKARARSEGLDPASQGYVDRVKELAKSSRSVIENDSELLQRAMRSNGRLRKTDFISEASLSPESGEDIRKYLIGKIGYSTTEEKARVDTLMTKFKQELESSHQFGGGKGVNGYRLNYARNQGLWGELAVDEKDLRNRVAAQGEALAWTRMKGSDEDVSTSLGERAREAGKRRDDLLKLQKNGSLDADGVAELKLLEGHLGVLGKLQGQSVEGNIHKAAVKEFWRDPVVGFKNGESDKLVREAARATFDLDIGRMKLLLGKTTDESERKRLLTRIGLYEQYKDKIGTIPGGEIRNSVNGLVGAFRTFKGSILQGGLGAGYITGDSYHNLGAGELSPGQFSNVSFWRRTADGKYEKVFYGKADKKTGVISENDAGSIVLSRDDGMYHLNRLSALYYLTPISLLKTAAWNGEGWAFLAEMQQRSIQKAFGLDRGDLLKKYVKDNKALFGGVKDLFEGDEVNMGILARNYLEVMDILAVQENLPEGLKKVLQVAQRKYKSVLRYSERANRIITSIGGAVGGYFTGAKVKIAKFFKLDKESVSNLFNKVFKSKALQAKFGLMLNGKLGIRQVVNEGIKIALQALIQALGIGLTGGVANVIAVIAWGGGELAMKLVKPLLGLSLIAIWGLCGCIGFAYFQMNFLLPTKVAHTALAPTDYEIIGVELFPDGQPWDNPDIGYGDPPHDGICPVASSGRCTQGPYGTFSHVQMGTMAIDVAGSPGLWRAPSDGTVTQAIDSVDCGWQSGVSSGGKILFVDVEGNEYRILHVVPLVGTGPVTKGTAIARLATNLQKSACWTGAHYHIDTKANGGWVNSLDWYKKLGCNLTCP